MQEPKNLLDLCGKIQFAEGYDYLALRNNRYAELINERNTPMPTPLLDIAQKAKQASYEMMTAGTTLKNNALLHIADAVEQNAELILLENEKDLANAREKGIPDAMLDRLALSKARIADMASAVREVALLPDPIGRADAVWQRPNGLRIEKRRVPLGVVGIIYEARPNVTLDALALCLKTGNVCILRGGSEAINSNIAITNTAVAAAVEAGLPEGAIALVEDTSRDTARELMRLNGYVDVLIPRGGASLIRSVVENASVPVIETGLGNCHVYVDETADFDMAKTIIVNAKCSRPSVCNAAETLLVSENIAAVFLPECLSALAEKGVELRGCERARAIYPGAKPATDEDWLTEYDDLILAVKIVSDVEEAIAHINRCGTRHSEAIVTESYKNAKRFLDAVDAAAVYVNASTRFTDGNEFGFGAEIGISTQKLHARGPMGLEELTSVKYVVYGDGQVR